MPQDLSAPVSGNGANEKCSVPVTPAEGSIDKEIMAIEEAVPSFTNKETGAHQATKAMRRRAWIQFATLCWSIFVVGWNDGTTGPLVPRLQEVYHVSYAIVSLIFIASCVGFISGASSYIYLTDRFGFGLVWVDVL